MAMLCVGALLICLYALGVGKRGRRTVIATTASMANAAHTQTRGVRLWTKGGSAESGDRLTVAQARPAPVGRLQVDDDDSLGEAMDRFEAIIQKNHPRVHRALERSVVAIVVHTPEELIQIETRNLLSDAITDTIAEVLRDCLDDYESDFIVTKVSEKN